MGVAILVAQGQGAALGHIPAAFALGALHPPGPGHAGTVTAGLVAAAVAASSLGRAAVVVGVGVAAAFGSARLDGAGRWMRSLPALPVAVITLAGLCALAKVLASLAV